MTGRRAARAIAALGTVLAAALATALTCAVAVAAPAEHSPLGTEAARRVALGEAALQHGDAAEALSQFEAAAAMQHAAEIELGIVRAQMQAGQYRRALAFAAHVAGAHTDEPEAAALYAWLLQAGGQSAYAQHVLDQALARSPAQPALLEARAALANAAQPVARGVLLEAPQRAAPFASGPPDAEPLPGAARAAGSAVLLDARTALAPLARVAAARAVWVRDGLGRTRAARVTQRDEARGIATLALASSLPSMPPIGAVQATPWAGSPGFVVGYASATDAAPQWPLLHPGFFADDGLTATHAVGVAAPGAVDGVMFDASGRWSGFVLPAASMPPGARRWLLPAMLRAAVPSTAAPGADDESVAPNAGAAARRVGADEVYEHALPLVLQLIVAD